MEPLKEDGGSCVAFPHPTCISPLDNYFILNVGFILFFFIYSLTLNVQPHGMSIPCHGLMCHVLNCPHDCLI